MARSVFYYHLKRLEEPDKYAVEKEEIKSIFHEHKGRYGYRRVTWEMRNRGYVINHKTVQRLMTEMHIKCKMRKVRYRSYKGEVGSLAPNIIGRNFVATEPNRKWATDVTQINIGATKLYLSSILICSMVRLFPITYLTALILNKYMTCSIKHLISVITLTDSYFILIKVGNTNTSDIGKGLKGII